MSVKYIELLINKTFQKRKHQAQMVVHVYSTKYLRKKLKHFSQISFRK